MRRWVLLLGLLTLAGCGDAAAFVPDLGSEALMQTAGLKFSLSRNSIGWEVRIPYTYENRTGERVYLINCLGGISPTLERRSGDAWRSGWEPAEEACLSPAVVIEPGATFTGVAGVIAGTFGSNSAPQFSTPDATGVYRLRWERARRSLRDPYSFGDPLPIEWRVSNEFFLVQP